MAAAAPVHDCLRRGATAGGLTPAARGRGLAAQAVRAGDLDVAVAHRELIAFAPLRLYRRCVAEADPVDAPAEWGHLRCQEGEPVAQAVEIVGEQVEVRFERAHGS